MSYKKEKEIDARAYLPFILNSQAAAFEGGEEGTAVIFARYRFAFCGRRVPFRPDNEPAVIAVTSELRAWRSIRAAHGGAL